MMKRAERVIYNEEIEEDHEKREHSLVLWDTSGTVSAAHWLCVAALWLG